MGDAGEKTKVLAERLRAVGVVPVVELEEVEYALPLVEALSGGGLDCVEITLRTPAAQAGLTAIRHRFPDLLLGAGTVLTENQVDVAIACDVDFVVSPGTNPALVRRCVARGMPILPGVCTPSDIEVAHGLGIELMKFFPAEPMGGAGFLRALCGPYRDARFVPTGGITGESLPEYLALPQVLACGGSWLVKSAFIRAGDFAHIRRLTEEAVRIVRDSRGSAPTEARPPRV